MFLGGCVNCSLDLRAYTSSTMEHTLHMSHTCVHRHPYILHPPGLPLLPRIGSPACMAAGMGTPAPRPVVDITLSGPTNSSDAD